MPPLAILGDENLSRTAGSIVGGGFNDAGIAIVSLKTGQSRTILKGGYHGRYLPAGISCTCLIGLNHQDKAPESRETLFGVPFDERRE